MTKVNIGCGLTFHPDWVNIDYVSHSDDVIKHDVVNGLPFSDSSVDCCYSSHLLEHLKPSDALRLLSEMHRVLIPGGLIRIALPDLEMLVKNYLKHLELAIQDQSFTDDYDWTVIQMLDQMVRTTPGGIMAEYWRDKSRTNDDFVRKLAGLEAYSVIRTKYHTEISPQRSIIDKIMNKNIAWYVAFSRNMVSRLILFLIGGRKAKEAFEVGVFRSSGEVHQWMYDRYSLNRILLKAGFDSPRIVTAFESEIPDFSSYDLDVVDGVVRKPDSLFMEAIKIR